MKTIPFIIASKNQTKPGTSLVVQWLRPHASNARGTGSIPGWGTKIPHAAGYDQGKKKKKLKNKNPKKPKPNQTKQQLGITQSKEIKDLYLENCKNLVRDFPGSPVVKTLHFHHRGHGFDPWSGKIPHATEQLGPRATTTEPACHNYRSPRA